MEVNSIVACFIFICKQHRYENPIGIEHYAKQSGKRYDNWTILKIDTTKTKNVYYKDINIPNNVAIWTGEHISPSAITIFDNFNI